MTKMEIGEVVSLLVKQEPGDEFGGEVNSQDHKNMDNGTQTCVICSQDVPERKFWEHVKGRHGFIEVEYQSVAKHFDNPKIYEGPKEGEAPAAEGGIDDGCKFKCKYCDHESISWRKMTKHEER